MDLTRKARWVLDDHKTPDPVGSRYAGVVSRESVRIVFTYAALNELDVCMAHIRNAYLQSPTSQKHYIICGPEFGIENVGKVAIMGQSMVEKQAEEITEITLDHACISSILLHVQLILMFR